MFRCLEIDAYKEGFNVSHIDCIDLPIAGTTGYYNYDNYYFYCFYICFLNNWTDIETTDRFFVCSHIMSKLGLKMNILKAQSSSEFIRLVKNSIENLQPVMSIVYYKHLFYDKNYMDEDTGDDLHGLLINEYNSDTSVIGIRDCTIVRDHKPVGTDADVLFKLRLTEEMLANIWEHSSVEIKKEKIYSDNSFFSVEKTSAPIITSFMELVGDMLDNYDLTKSKLAYIVDNYEHIMPDFNKKIEYYKRKFHGSFTVFFSVLERTLSILNQKAEKYSKFNEMKSEYMEFRENLVSKLYITSVRGKMLSDDEKKDIIEKIHLLDTQLFSFIRELYVEQKNSLDSDKYKEYKYIDLSEYLNNEGFGQSLSQSTTADLTKKGEYFLTNDLLERSTWTIDDMKFIFPQIIDGIKDNISCDGQTIQGFNGCYRSVMILGCSEWGNYSENLEIEYSNGDKDTLCINLSDWAFTPVFNEKIAWSGQAAVRKDGETKLWDFTARLFAKAYKICDNKEIVKIKLPRRNNMHIFALTLAL
ncbi:MAG: hypothetical protein BWY74_02129 [Firmicutes bacterium ADurb.Bin419]|nr:MAG: hypothetical protein BWY74_02129 [Firmicutes bacterium ADurb.Bin419]